MSRNLRILIVEDKPIWSAAIKTNLLTILNDLRIANTIEVVATFDEAKIHIRKAVETPYDLVSLDIHLEDIEHRGGGRDGLILLRDIQRYNAAWMVSILTGVESDPTVKDTVGAERARILQDELRSRAYVTFPPERLLVMEKPSIDSDNLTNKLRQICTILKLSLETQNIFRLIELPCQIAMHETVDGTWLKKNSSECEQARKTGKLKKKGTKTQNAAWFDDTVSLRQIRFRCGEIITTDDNVNFQTIEWLIRHPGTDFTAEQIGGDAVTISLTSGYDEAFENEEDFFDKESISAARDFESDLQKRSGGEWDDTEKISREAYQKQLNRLKSELETTSTSNRQKINGIKESIAALESEMKKLRRGTVGSKTHDSIKQHKSRAIAALKEAGQLELAEHFEGTIRVEGAKIGYHSGQEYGWNT